MCVFQELFSPQRTQHFKEVPELSKSFANKLFIRRLIGLWNELSRVFLSLYLPPPPSTVCHYKIPLSTIEEELIIKYCFCRCRCRECELKRKRRERVQMKFLCRRQITSTQSTLNSTSNILLFLIFLSHSNQKKNLVCEYFPPFNETELNSSPSSVLIPFASWLIKCKVLFC